MTDAGHAWVTVTETDARGLHPVAVHVLPNWGHTHYFAECWCEPRVETNDACGIPMCIPVHVHRAPH